MSEKSQLLFKTGAKEICLINSKSILKVPLDYEKKK